MLHEELKLSWRKHWYCVEGNQFMKTIQEFLKQKSYKQNKTMEEPIEPASAFEQNYAGDALRAVSRILLCFRL